MNFIDVINRYIKGRCALTGQGATDVLMELADLAGFDTFNPHDVSDGQLQEIASVILKSQIN